MIDFLLFAVLCLHSIGILAISVASWRDVVSKRGFQLHDIMLVCAITGAIVSVPFYWLVFLER